MRALSIRQPYAELILRGVKPIEFRSRPTKIIGERFYIYASKQWAVGKLFLEGCRLAGSGQMADSTGSPQAAGSTEQTHSTGLGQVWSHDLAMPGDEPQPWMLELAKMLILKDLPTGVIVGSAVIEKVERREAGSEEEASVLLPTAGRPLPTLYQWHLTGVERVKKLRKPKGHPQPVWFRA
jgi:predicted transcriptional regulator